MNEKITIILYNKPKEFDTKEKAEEFLLDCMANSEGSERDRYTNAYLKLKDGLMVCDDEDYF